MLLELGSPTFDFLRDILIVLIILITPIALSLILAISIIVLLLGAEIKNSIRDSAVSQMLFKSPKWSKSVTVNGCRSDTISPTAHAQDEIAELSLGPFGQLLPWVKCRKIMVLFESFTLSPRMGGTESDSSPLLM